MLRKERKTSMTISWQPRYQPKTITKCIIPPKWRSKISDVAQEKEKSRSFLALRYCACVYVGKGMINQSIRRCSTQAFREYQTIVRELKKKSTSRIKWFIIIEMRIVLSHRNVYNYDNYPFPISLSLFPVPGFKIPFLRTSIRKKKKNSFPHFLTFVASPRHLSESGKRKFLTCFSLVVVWSL